MWSSFVSKIRYHITIIAFVDCLVSVSGHAEHAWIAQRSRNTSRLYVQGLKKVLFGNHPPPPPLRSSPLPIISHNSLLVTMTFEISARGRSCFPWSVVFLGFFLAACSKIYFTVFFTTVQFVKKQDFYIKKQLFYKNIFLLKSRIFTTVQFVKKQLFM